MSTDRSWLEKGEARSHSDSVAVMARAMLVDAAQKWKSVRRLTARCVNVLCVSSRSEDSDNNYMKDFFGGVGKLNALNLGPGQISWNEEDVEPWQRFVYVPAFLFFSFLHLQHGVMKPWPGTIGAGMVPVDAPGCIGHHHQPPPGGWRKPGEAEF